MIIRVRLFARAKDLAGTEMVSLDLVPGTRVADLRCDEVPDVSAVIREAVPAFCANYFWHFGHQKVERPFWTKRRTMPPQRAVWHFSPSRS